MSKMEDKKKRRAATKAKNLAKTAKTIEKFVCSFYLNDVEIQAQRPYKTSEDIEEDRKALAEIKKIPAYKIISKIIDNRNKTEKKAAGVKVPATSKKKKVLAEQSSAPLPPAYRQITPEQATIRFVEITRKIQKSTDAGTLMAKEHKEEKQAHEAELELLEKELCDLADMISPKQLDIFRHAKQPEAKQNTTPTNEPGIEPKEAEKQK